MNVTSQVRDLPGNSLVTSDRPNPAIGGYDVYEDSAFNTVVPNGWRLYFRTLEVPNTALAINEDFNSNLAEWGDLGSGDTEPGLYTHTVADNDTTPGVPDGLPLNPNSADDAPNEPRVFLPMDPMALSCGQTTTADWNNGAGTGYRFLNLNTIPPNLEDNMAVAAAGQLPALSGQCH